MALALAELAIEKLLYTPNAEETRLLLADLPRAGGSVPRLAAWLGLAAPVLSDWVYGKRSPRTPGRRLVWLAWSLVFEPNNLVEWLARMPRRCRPRSKRSSQGAGVRATGN
jgi:hypothetical protein